MAYRRLPLLLPPVIAAGVLAWLRQDYLLGAFAVYAGVLVVLFRTPGDVKAVAREAAERDRAFARERADLQARVDFLSAEREISLILNEDVDFRTILDKVLTITADTLGASEIAVYVKGEKGLAPKAARVGGATVFDEGPADPLLDGCLEAAKPLFKAEEGRLQVYAPLSSDRELMGAVRFTTDPERGEVLSRHLAEFSKFLALALKTPDLYTRATVDGLTGLASKRHFLKQLEAEIAVARRSQEVPSLIMIDVDHFKKVNDTHGHVAGDRILKGVAEILLRSVRRSDGSAYRYGGEEMAILLPRTSLERAAEVAERLRSAIEDRKFPIDKKKSLHVTASFGVARFSLSMEDATEMVQAADEALYRAKEGGRNRVCTAEGTARAKKAG